MADSKRGLNINLMFVTFIVAFGSSIMFGYNIAALNQSKQFIVDFYNETYGERQGAPVSEGTLTLLWSLTTALFIPGGMIGSFLGGWLADKIGRKRTILFSHSFTIVGAVMSCLCVIANSPELLMIGRFLVGINSGLGNGIAPMVLLEITPKAYRGAFGTVHQLSITLGILIASVLGLPQLLGTVDLWPFIVLVEVIPAVTSLAILPFVPDTPRYLLLIRNNRSEALKSMRFYRRSEDVAEDMAEMDAEGGAGGRDQELRLLDYDAKNEKYETKDDNENRSTAVAKATESQDSSYSWRSLLTDIDLRRPLLIACMLVIIQQFSGINAFFFFSQSVFQNARIDAAVIPFAVIGVNAVNVLTTVIVVPLLDIAGRRLLLIIPAVVMVVDLVAMTISLVLMTFYDNPAIGYVSIMCVVVYVICFAFGLGPIPWILGAEMFRQEPRPKAMAMVNVTMWISAFVIAMVFEPLQAWARQYTFLVFLVLMSGFTVFLYLFVPETKNKTIDEIARELSPSSRRSAKESVNATSNEKIC